MPTTRRSFLRDTALLSMATALGCRSSAAPAIVTSSQRAVTQTLPGMPTTDGAGVRLLRVIGQPALKHLDPFVLLDRFHSDDPGAYIKGFPDHPHRGFETVTVMLDGRMRHRDSRGNQGLIQGGGAQWMTAGRGIVHSEMPEQERGLMSGFQLWINLPAKEKMRSQEYQDLAPAQLAEARLSSAGSVMRVIAGQANGLTGPVRDRVTAPLLLTVVLEDEQPFELDLPENHTAFTFVHQGAVFVGEEGKAGPVSAGTLALVGPGKKLRLRAKGERSALLVAAARPLAEPIVQRGPFVMNTEAEIQKAWDDYRKGVLDKG